VAKWGGIEGERVGSLLTLTLGDVDSGTQPFIRAADLHRGPSRVNAIPFLASWTSSPPQLSGHMGPFWRLSSKSAPFPPCLDRPPPLPICKRFFTKAQRPTFGPPPPPSPFLCHPSDDIVGQPPIFPLLHTLRWGLLLIGGECLACCRVP